MRGGRAKTGLMSNTLPVPHIAALTLHGPEAGTHFGQTLAPLPQAGDVLLLEGPIGAGKTHFARAVIQHLLARPEDVPSPTFTLVQVYEAAQCEIWHADLYRLSQSDEIEELGLVEAFDTAICLVEWPDRLGALAPDGALSLQFRADATGDAREVEIFGAAEWSRRLKGVLHG